MTRKEYRAKMRALHGADWWKDKSKAKALAKKYSGEWYENWPTFAGWVHPSVMEPHSDSPYVAYGHAEDGSRLDVAIHKKRDGFHVTGEADELDLGSDGEWVLVREDQIDKRGLTMAQAIAAVKKLVEPA